MLNWHTQHLINIGDDVEVVSIVEQDGNGKVESFWEANVVEKTPTRVKIEYLFWVFIMVDSTRYT